MYARSLGGSSMFLRMRNSCCFRTSREGGMRWTTLCGSKPRLVASPMAVARCRAHLLEPVVGDTQAIYHEVVNLPG